MEQAVQKVQGKPLWDLFVYVNVLAKVYLQVRFSSLADLLEFGLMPCPTQ
jgi:hypothetical protein